MKAVGNLEQDNGIKIAGKEDDIFSGVVRRVFGLYLIGQKISTGSSTICYRKIWIFEQRLEGGSFSVSTLCSFWWFWDKCFPWFFLKLKIDLFIYWGNIYWCSNNVSCISRTYKYTEEKQTLLSSRKRKMQNSKWSCCSVRLRGMQTVLWGHRGTHPKG